ncbi:MAG: AAA family ATPase [Myxococcaceae bacterium]|jgi:energy-coupling factor transporter ATP-binding protein EcfA2|nr:AAA family ATPase [Myxococcaceae bacterium]
MGLTRLEIRNFAQIEEAVLDLGDLTVLVGPQGSGKSLALQWLKTALDGRHIVKALEDAGADVRKADALIDLIFGVGMKDAWHPNTEVSLDGTALKRDSIKKRGTEKESVFFVPAHRASLISDGWAQPFQKFTAETPVVARLFSQTLFELFTGKDSTQLFPLNRVLKKEYRELIDRAVFHSGTIGLEEDAQHAKRLRLTHGSSKLPFMTWTAGQREFTPLLLGLYHLLPPRKLRKQPHINWVIIEEPEMGLHPQALSAFLLMVLDLLWRGYRVVLSTHSPVVLTMMWMLRVLRSRAARSTLVCEGFGVTPNQQMKKVADTALSTSVELRTFVMEFQENGKVRSRDISGLDPGSDDPAEAGWGGLTGFTTQFSEAVRTAVAEADE